MPYIPNPVWKDNTNPPGSLPSSGSTPILATNLNHIEQGLVAVAAQADLLQSSLFTPRVITLAVDTNNTYTINANVTDVALIVNPTANFTVANPTGIFADEQPILIKITNGSTSYIPSWGSAFISSGVAILPGSALPANKTTTFGFKYDAARSLWVLLASDIIGY